MQKPPIFNRYLNKKWNDIENDIMVQKLSQAKPTINQACPESYNFFKNKLKKPKLSAIEICINVIFKFTNIKKFCFLNYF